jgi:hypothetical protein
MTRAYTLKPGFCRVVEKERQKTWYDHNIYPKILHLGSLFLLYDNKYLQHPGKRRMHWLDPFWLVYISEAGAANLVTLQGHPF